MTLTIGVDVGGTKTVAGVVDDHGQVLAHTRCTTPAHDAAEIRGVIVSMISELAASHAVQAVGVGSAGWVDAARSTVVFATNLAWDDEPLSDHIVRAVGLPTVVENDANVAAWAEFRFGAARHAQESMAMIVVGTGIGCGIVINGGLWRGSHGTAGELGHMRSVPDGHPCGCGRRGCLDQYASGRALVRLARQGAERHPGRATRLLDLAGGRLDAVTGSVITAAAAQGDPVATEAFATIGAFLGIALADLTQLIDPQVVVLGGGVFEAGELLLGSTERAFREELQQRGRRPVAELRVAEMGNSAGLIGAADLARTL